METSKFILDSKDTKISEAQYVASGSTSICYKIRYYGKWFLQKKLRDELADNPNYRLAFRKEFELGIQLEHPNIIRYIDFHEDGNDIYIRTDFVDGRALSAFIQDNADFLIERQWQKQFVKELFSAIEYLHQRQILHLDLKPDNMMITTVGHHLKLIDLGFSYQDCYQGNYGGSPRYSAPELFQQGKGKVSQASDIYAIGQIFQELHIGGKSVINKCISQEVEKRYQSISELNNALHSYLKWYICGFVLLLFTLVILFWLFYPSEGTGNIISQKKEILKTLSVSTPFVHEKIDTDSLIQRHQTELPLNFKNDEGTESSPQQDKPIAALSNSSTSIPPLLQSIPQKFSSGVDNSSSESFHLSPFKNIYDSRVVKKKNKRQIDIPVFGRVDADQIVDMKLEDGHVVKVPRFVKDKVDSALQTGKKYEIQRNLDFVKFKDMVKAYLEPVRIYIVTKHTFTTQNPAGEFYGNYRTMLINAEKKIRSNDLFQQHHYDKMYGDWYGTYAGNIINRGMEITDSLRR